MTISLVLSTGVCGWVLSLFVAKPFGVCLAVGLAGRLRFFPVATPFVVADICGSDDQVVRRYITVGRYDAAVDTTLARP